MEEGDNWGNRLTHASMETTDVKPLMMIYARAHGIC